jgi:hypothetical protein
MPTVLITARVDQDHIKPHIDGMLWGKRPKTPLNKIEMVT